MNVASLLVVAAAIFSLFAIGAVATERSLLAARVGIPVNIVGEGLGHLQVEAWLREIAVPVAAGGAGWLIAGPIAALVAIAAAFGLPIAIRRRNEKRDASRLAFQLGDGISTVAAGLRAGLSLSQSLRVAADESLPPLSASFQAVVEREAMGVPLSRSLDIWAAEHDGPDVRLVASVFQLHRRSGGDLPAVLDGVARTLRDRLAQARESQSLTAQARLSGLVLGFLPIGFFCFLSVMSPQDMSAAYRTPAGIGAISVGLLLQAGAFVWIRHLLRAGD